MMIESCYILVLFYVIRKGIGTGKLKQTNTITNKKIDYFWNMI